MMIAALTFFSLATACHISRNATIPHCAGGVCTGERDWKGIGVVGCSNHSTYPIDFFCTECSQEGCANQCGEVCVCACELGKGKWGSNERTITETSCPQETPDIGDPSCLDKCSVLDQCPGHGKDGIVHWVECGDHALGFGSFREGCFQRDTTACRVRDMATSPADAFDQCFGGATPLTAKRLPMAELQAGDLVLSSMNGAIFTERIVVNQHRQSNARAALITLHHSAGSLSLTPNHVLWIDGAYRPAREAVVGSSLSDGLVVNTIVDGDEGRIVNPITTGGTILAAGKDGGLPVLSVTGEEWLSDVILSGYPQYTLSFALAAAFPERVQAYYDAVLEPVFNTAGPYLSATKAFAPYTALVVMAVILGDILVAAGFVAFVAGNLALLVPALVLASSKLPTK